MKAKGNSIPVTSSLAFPPDGFLQRGDLPRNAVPFFALLPFAFCLLPS
jgi:hypothetical protein